METQPLPLETLVPLLTHSLFTSDPRFDHLHLYDTSHTSPNLQVLTRFMTHELFSSDFIDEPKSILSRDLHIYKCHTADTTSAPRSSSLNPSAILLPPHLRPHPLAPNLFTLSPHALYLIYMQTRSHDACYKAAYLYEKFISICPIGQLLSIKSSKHEIITFPSFRAEWIQFRLKDPSHHTIVGRTTSPYTMLTGSRNLEWHCVVGIPIPPSSPLCTISKKRRGPDVLRSSAKKKELDNYLILDMTRMQYGLNALVENGTVAQTYFLGSWRDYVESMKGICGKIVDVEVLGSDTEGGDRSALRKRLDGCAVEALRRWERRAIDGWCKVCGGLREDGGTGEGSCSIHKGVKK